METTSYEPNDTGYLEYWTKFLSDVTLAGCHNYALLKMHFLQIVHFLAPRVGDKSSFSWLPRFQRQEGGDVEKRKGWVKAWFTLLCSFVDLSACFGSQRACDGVVAVINHNVSAPYNTILFMNLFIIAINTNCSVLHFSQLFCEKAEYSKWTSIRLKLSLSIPPCGKIPP